MVIDKATHCQWKHRCVNLQNGRQRRKSNWNVAPSKSRCINGAANIFVSPARRKQQLTAPDVSACYYFTRTNNLKMAAINPFECLPSKLLRRVKLGGPSNYTKDSTRTNATAARSRQSARTQNRHHPQGISPAQGRFQRGGVGARRKGLHKSHQRFLRVLLYQLAHNHCRCAPRATVPSRKGGGEWRGDPIGRGAAYRATPCLSTRK